MDHYTTLRQSAQAEFVERRSRFIGYAAPVQTEQQALAFLAEKRTRHWDASHNVYAYILREGSLKRYSDDGEPQGTAGIPVLDLLQKQGLTDLVVVVTRYFGGVLLGAGGLVRAYSHAAKLGVEAAQPLTMCACTTLLLEMGYDWYGKVSYLLPQFGVKTIGSDFGAVVRIELLLRDTELPAFEKALTELTAAQVTAEVTGHRWDSIEL